MIVDVPWSEAEADDLVGPGELAELIGGTAKALGMLRKRNPDFPEPRATAGRTPLFRLGDFVHWYEDTYARGGPVAARGDWRRRRALEACRLDQGLDETRRFVVGTIALCHRSPSTAADLAADGGDVAAALPDGIATLADHDGRLAGVVDRLIGEVDVTSEPATRLARRLARAVVGGKDPARLADGALRHLTAMATPAGTTTSEWALVDLLLAVADPTGTSIVFDPAAGEGALLLAAGESTGWTARLRGQERDEWAWRIALARASLHDGADLVDLGPGPADSLTDDQWPTLRADLCVCDTPFHGKGIDRWLLHSLAHLGPDGRAVVCLPVKTLDPGRREWRVLPTGSVEAVVLCPPGLRADTAEPIAIWSVTRRTNTHVLIVDASGLDLPTQDPHDSAGEQRGIDALRDTLRHWRSTGEIPTQPPPGLHLAAVSTPDLADRDGDLRPATWTRQPTQAADDETVERALTLARDLHDLIEGPLRGTTTEEHRRGLRRLIKRLGHGSDG